MRDHDIDAEGPEQHGAGQRERRPEDGDPDIGRALAAARPDTLGPSGIAHLQRAAGNAGVGALLRSADERAGDDDSPVHGVVAGPGEPLDRDTRGLMEERLGHDFSDVRVHTDPAAAASARSVQAHAYTVGNHVVFGEGRYRPDSDEGRHTIAHELVHVTQQREGSVDGTPAAGGIKVSHPDDRFERHAERTAAEALAPGAGTAPAPEAHPPAAVQRLDDGGAEPQHVQRAPEEEEEPDAGPVSEAPEEQTDEDVPVSTLAVQRQDEDEHEDEETEPSG